jgi:hypothetical protein
VHISGIHFFNIFSFHSVSFLHFFTSSIFPIFPFPFPIKFCYDKCKLLTYLIQCKLSFIPQTFSIDFSMLQYKNFKIDHSKHSLKTKRVMKKNLYPLSLFYSVTPSFSALTVSLLIYLYSS